MEQQMQEQTQVTQHQLAAMQIQMQEVMKDSSKDCSYQHMRNLYDSMQTTQESGMESIRSLHKSVETIQQQVKDTWKGGGSHSLADLKAAVAMLQNEVKDLQQNTLEKEAKGECL